MYLQILAWCLPVRLLSLVELGSEKMNTLKNNQKITKDLKIGARKMAQCL